VGPAEINYSKTRLVQFSDVYCIQMTIIIEKPKKKRSDFE
jgi:hypothetical protein